MTDSISRLFRYLPWIGLALLGSFALGTIALSRGEQIGAIWLLTAAICFYLIGYRFYSRIVAYKIFALDERRATPAERMEDGRDYVPTNKWIVFGHHFAAIAGPGPLVGPTLAAQFGFLPGALWIVIGVVLGGAVQDFVILAASLRRNGKSLGQMAREEIGKVAGVTALVAVLGIMVILLSVLALVVVTIATIVGHALVMTQRDRSGTVVPTGNLREAVEAVPGAAGLLVYLVLAAAGVTELIA